MQMHFLVFEPAAERPLLTRNIYAFGKDPWVNLVPDKCLNETLEQKDL